MVLQQPWKKRQKKRYTNNPLITDIASKGNVEDSEYADVSRKQPCLLQQTYYAAVRVRGERL